MIDKINSNFPRGVEVVCGAIIENSAGKILLTKSPKWSNKWTVPGGHLDPGESISGAVVREAKEEIGLNIDFVKIVSFGELINSSDFHRPAHFVYFDGYCKHSSGDILLDNKELTEYRWEDPESALGLDLAESFDRSIGDFIKYKKSLK